MQLQQLQFSGRQKATHYFNMCRRILSCTTPVNSKDSQVPLVETVIFLNSLHGSSQLGLIKVLDLEFCHGLNKRNLRHICNKIFQLKYLSLRKTGVDGLPKEIGKLQDLETFDIRDTKIKSFPANADVLQNLMHLLAGGHIGSDESLFSTVHIPSGVGSMTNIQVLSHVEVSDSVDTKELEGIGQLQELRKLGVVVVPGNKHDTLTVLLRVIGRLDECLCSLSVHIEPVDNREAEVDMNPEVTEISHPRSLQVLNINGKITGLPTWIKKLHQLSRITLCRTSLKATEIELLGKLVNLRILLLQHDSYKQKHLTFKNKEFKQLHILVVEGSDISKIHFDLSAAPKLEKIVWKSTSSSMAEMYGIRKLPSLKLVKLNGNFKMVIIKKELRENPSLPVLSFYQKLSPDDAAATDAKIASPNIPGLR